ncbi:MAG: HD family phosphohydrolase [Dehalococcoidia bacterium]
MEQRPQVRISRRLAALSGVAVAVVVALALAPLFPRSEVVREGDRAPRTLVANRDAQYESAAETDAVRESAAAAVKEIYFPPDPAIRQQQVERIDRLFADFRVLRGRTELSPAQQLSEAASLVSAATIPSTVHATLLTTDRNTFETLARTVTSAVSDLLRIAVEPGGSGARVSEHLDAAAKDPQSPKLDAGAATAQRELLRAFVVANVTVDQAATGRARDEARERQAPVIVSFSRGQVIALQDEVLDAGDVEALRATGVFRSAFDLWRTGGGILFAGAFGALFAGCLLQMQPFAQSHRRLVWATVALLGAVALTARTALPALMPDRDGLFLQFALPFAAVPMLLVAFTGAGFAVVVAGLVAALATLVVTLAPGLAGSTFVSSTEAIELAAVFAVTGVAGALTLARAESLSRYGVAAITCTAASAGVLLAFWLTSEPRSNEALGWLVLAAVLNGIGSAILASGGFTLLAMAFGLTTRIQLMELAQGGHPVLRRMQDEAPGTYHHSMMVGALAERAANRIGGDALLARVGAYYHDIGKIAQPAYYIENTQEGVANPHDSIDPVASAQAIRAHVSNGLELAVRYRIPPVVRDFIPEHHGTRLVSYFYRTAVERDPAVSPEPFRYGGPRPKTRESAIVMLADSCEAVVRASQQAGGRAIDELVDGIVAERLAEGQLDDCDITMRDLHAVAGSFKATLRAIYHPRIAYPTPAPEEIARIAQGPLPEEPDGAPELPAAGRRARRGQTTTRSHRGH